MNDTLDWEKLVTNPSQLSLLATGHSFTKLRCFHLCRPEDVTPYYTDGIRLFSRDELCQAFRQIFSNLPSVVVDAAITNTPESETRQEVYVGVDCRFLLQHCGHYCIYGSEHITSLCNHLNTGDGSDWRQQLTLFGKPTVIVLEIPFDRLPSPDVDELNDELQRVANGEKVHLAMPGMLLDIGISFDHPLPPEWIVSHHYPVSVFDPLLKKQYECPS